MTEDKKQIYIVDDDESVCRALKILLMTFGFDVSAYTSAEDFFSGVPDSSAGCLILDIHMPGMDGWEVLKRVVKSGSRRPVIIITADKNGGMRELAVQNGAAGYFQKPIKDRELVEMINRTY